jgi:hypothetical protein
MDNKKYLRIENNSFGFVADGIHEIKETDIEISIDDYDTFFEMQSQGKQFKLKNNPTGTGLFDYIEEYIPEPIEVKLELDAEDHLLDLEHRVSLLELGV